MTLRQMLLKGLYPAYLWLSRLTGSRSQIMQNSNRALPASTLYDLEVPLVDGRTLQLRELKGKKLLLVNTASDCIYTAQYKDLQDLMAHYGDGLVVIAFPSNDFREQEKGSDKDIANFCQRNYGVTFPVAHKGSVICGPQQQSVFQWLTNKSLNGWNTKQPTWNFSKYLINEEGVLTHYFDPGITPAHHELLRAIHHG